VPRATEFLQSQSPHLNLQTDTGIVVSATPARRRGPSLSRRTGQLGNVYQPAHPGKWNSTAPCYGRVWIDIPGNPERDRRTVPLGICRTKTAARQRLREWIEREGINSKEQFHKNTAPALTFRQQAEAWIVSLPNRRRRPVKPATIHGWRHSLNKWLLPTIGDLALSDVGNGALKTVVDKMSVAGLAAQSIITHTRVLKLVVASAVNSEGEELYPRKWNNAFAGVPLLDPTKQHRPTFTLAEVESLIAGVRPSYRIAVALLAVTGMRVGEGLAVTAENFSPDCRVLTVRRSMWHGHEQDPKTPNSFRLIDIPEQFAAVLREFVAGKSGYLFPTRNGQPWGQRNFLRALHNGGADCGFHAFRRFRTETLEGQDVPKDIINGWLGWRAESMADRYGEGLKKNEARRRKWVEVAGVGFSLNGLQRVTNVVSIRPSEAA
jgi:integrase